MAWNLDDILGGVDKVGDAVRKAAGVYDDVTRRTDPATASTVPATTKAPKETGVDQDQVGGFSVTPALIVVGVIIGAAFLTFSRR